MSRAADLVRAILGGRCTDEAQAVWLLEEALELEVDPMDFLVHRFWLSESDVYERAARWVGLMFRPVVPRVLEGGAPQVERLDALGETRCISACVRGQDIAFAAPRFAAFVRLAERASPEMQRRLCIVPPSAIRSRIAELSEDILLDESRQRLARRWPFASASFDLPLPARVAFVAALAMILIVTIAAPFAYKPLLLPPLAIFLVLPAVIRLAAVLLGRRDEDALQLDDAELPIYSVLIPLRDEAEMVPQLVRAMGAIDYPPEKLQVLFVVEQKSAATVAAVNAALGDPRFQLVVVPDAPPWTKPKALDYALPMARGEHTVIFDAEDIPAPDQLRRAAARFAADPELDCLQAELGIDNGSESWLCALFAGEYAGLFNMLLPLLSRWHLPVPLGGTSNHFRTASLREIGGWDPFNVTEDADLGVRLARRRYRTGTLASRTGEEAPIALNAWMKQRTRWMKGWMQCLIVHNRSPRQLLQDLGWRNFLAFEIYVGGLILSALLHTVFMVTFGLRLAVGQVTEIQDAWDVAYLGVLVIGYGGSAALTVAGLLRARQAHLLPLQLLLPFYWVLHSAATVRAAHELLVRPYFWAKTAHGRTRVQR